MLATHSDGNANNRDNHGDRKRCKQNPGKKAHHQRAHDDDQRGGYKRKQRSNHAGGCKAKPVELVLIGK